MRWWCVVLAACVGPEFTGPAEIVVGTGEYEYDAVTDGQELPIIAGPQGGYHVWLGFLARNLRKRCVVETTLTFVEGEQAVGNPFFFEVDLFDAEDGWMQYAGLPEQFDKDLVEDQLVRIDVIVSDEDGNEASGAMQIIPRLL